MGLTFSNTEAATTIVRRAEAHLVGSATLDAFTMTAVDDGTVAGAAYSPLFEIVPHAAPPQLTIQVTAVFAAPVTVATNG